MHWAAASALCWITVWTTAMIPAACPHSARSIHAHLVMHMAVHNSEQGTKLLVRSLRHYLDAWHALWVQASRSSCSLPRSRRHRCSSRQLKTASGWSKPRPNLQLLSSKPSKRWSRCSTSLYFFASGNFGFGICVSHHLGMYAVPLVLC